VGERTSWYYDRRITINPGRSDYFGKEREGATISPYFMWFIDFKPQKKMGNDPNAPYVESTKRSLTTPAYLKYYKGKAKKLVEAEGVVKVEEDLYQVKSSSDPSKSYMVTNDSCDCLGFKNFYKFHHGKGLKANCSHLEAVRIYKKD